MCTEAVDCATDVPTRVPLGADVRVGAMRACSWDTLLVCHNRNMHSTRTLGMPNWTMLRQRHGCPEGGIAGAAPTARTWHTPEPRPGDPRCELLQGTCGADGSADVLCG